jgi:predicted helicase
LMRGENGLGVSYTRKMADQVGPRKHWLDDDYVKFLRLAHWHVDRIGAGTIGYVLGSGLIDNTSFGGLRHALLTSFDRVAIVNLHGAVKRGLEIADGVRDESVFGIEQGVALLLLTKHGMSPEPLGEFQCCDLKGARHDKLQKLAAATRGTAPLPFDRVTPQPPRLIFSASNEPLWREFQNGIPLDEIFIRSSSAIVTARDSLVVAHSKESLVRQMSVLADAKVDTEQIRQQFFPRARSKKYPRGDTRGWSLDEARERLRAEPNWDLFIVPVDYRPWDRRVLFYASWMVDWPRREISDVLVDGNNLCLVTRKQMVPGRPANFFWLTTHATIDGIVRSDNRGNETLYPLTARPGTARSSDGAGAEQQVQSNLHETARQRLLPTLTSRSQAAIQNMATDQDLLDYLLAMFFSREYRETFAECLWHVAPRAFPVRSEDDFGSLVGLGSRLRALLASVPGELPTNSPETAIHSHDSKSDFLTSAASGDGGRLRYMDEEIVAGDGERHSATREVWEFQVGSHQVARKWYREHQHLERDVRHRLFDSVLKLIRDTLAVQGELNEFYFRRGGFSSVHDLS